MKKINIIVALVLLVSATACQDGLDTVGNETNNVSYMSTDNAVVVFPKSTEGGETIIEPRLASLATEDTQITIAGEDFFEKYNQENKTKYKMLPIGEYTLYELSNPSNISTNGKLTVTIKKGSISSKVGVKVNALAESKYPFSIKYAIPLRIVGSSVQTLSNKDAVVSINRPFSTNVPTIPKGQNFVVELADDVPDSPNITIQAQYMFDQLTSVNGTTINMGYYGRLLPQGIQIKDGGTDTPFHKPGGKDIVTGKWYQITFVITQDKKFKIYFDGKLEQTLDRSVPGISKEAKARNFAVGNAAASYSHKYKVREIRLWNRALTEAEIKDNLYLPVDPNSEGLVAYLPLNDKEEGFVDKSKYENKVTFGQNKNNSSSKTITKEEFEKDVTWTEKVKFPAENLEIED